MLDDYNGFANGEGFGDGDADRDGNGWGDGIGIGNGKGDGITDFNLADYDHLDIAFQFVAFPE
jgi:hypothetical protein